MKASKGFTLIELMVVIAIIGILASIAMPQLTAIRIKSFNAAAASDVKNGLLNVETFFTYNHIYPDTHALVTGAGGMTLTSGAVSTAWFLSDGVSASYEKGATFGFCLVAKHQSGNRVYMAGNKALEPNMLSNLAESGAVLHASGAVLGTKDCSNMSASSISAIPVGS